MSHTVRCSDSRHAGNRKPGATRFFTKSVTAESAVRPPMAQGVVSESVAPRHTSSRSRGHAVAATLWGERSSRVRHAVPETRTALVLLSRARSATDVGTVRVQPFIALTVSFVTAARNETSHAESPLVKSTVRAGSRHFSFNARNAATPKRRESVTVVFWDGPG